METRAHHLYVGLFMLTLLSGLAIFVVWLGHMEWTTHTQPYLIYFDGSVTGLSIGSPVRYQGVPIGQVQSIHIDPANIQRVRVVVDIREDTPIRQDSVASLEVQGITGFVYVQIGAGQKDSLPLKAGEDGMPIIASRPSNLEKFFDAAPQLAQRLIVLTDDLRESSTQFRGLITDNRQAIRDFTQTGLYEVSTLIEEMRDAVTQLNHFMASVGRDPSQFLFGPTQQGRKVP